MFIFQRAVGVATPDGSMHESTKLSKIKCGDRGMRLGFKQLEFDLVQLPAQLINPRVDRRQLFLQSCDLGFVVVGSLGETHGFTGKRGDLQFMPVTVHQDLHLRDDGVDLALLVGQLCQPFVHEFEPNEYLSAFTG